MNDGPRQKRSTYTRQRILQAGMEQLEKEGYSNLTVSKVVTKAGLSIGAYMHHFSSKEKLIIGLIESFHKQRTEALEERFEALRIRNRGDIMYFLRTILEIQSGYLNNISNEFFMAQRTDPVLRWHGREVSLQNRKRSKDLYRKIFGPDVFDNSSIFEILDDYTNIFLRSISIISVVRDPEEVEQKIGTWLDHFCDLIEQEIKAANGNKDKQGELTERVAKTGKKSESDKARAAKRKKAAAK